MRIDQSRGLSRGLSRGRSRGCPQWHRALGSGGRFCGSSVSCRDPEEEEDPMARRIWLSLALTIVLTGCAQLTPEQQLISDVANGARWRALGCRPRGPCRSKAKAAISISGRTCGPTPRPRPLRSPATSASTTWPSGRMRLEQTRTPNFAFFQGPQAQRQIAGLDGDVAYNVGANGNADADGRPDHAGTQDRLLPPSADHHPSGARPGRQALESPDHRHRARLSTSRPRAVRP